MNWQIGWLLALGSNGHTGLEGITEGKVWSRNWLEVLRIRSLAGPAHRPLGAAGVRGHRDGLGVRVALGGPQDGGEGRGAQEQQRGPL